MERKLVGILVCMLLILTAISVSGNINNNNEVVEKTPIPAGDGNAVTIYLPDAHIYYHQLQIKWADVEFDDPGATIDVDLSELNIDEVITFNQTVYLHPVDETKQHLVFYQLDNSEYAGTKQGGIEWIDKDRDWKFYQHENVRLVEIVESEYYSMFIHVAGVPHFMKLPFLIYWQVLYFRQWMWKDLFPMPLVEKRGNSVEYQLHVHT